MLNGGGPVETMWVPKVDNLNTKTVEALLTSNRHVCGITVEPKARGQHDGADLGGQEDILSLLSGFRATHLPIMTSASPCTQDLGLETLCHSCTGEFGQYLT
jgi:hypothetical protein